ncbi:hypothetical protein [Streptomyces sp. NPDC002172]
MNERTAHPHDRMEPEESNEEVRAALLDAWTAGAGEETDRQWWIRGVR